MTEEIFRQKYPFIYSAQVKWGEMDALSHLNNTVYFRFAEEARIKLFGALKVPVTVDHATGPILAYIDCQFYAPVVFPDTLIVGSWVEHIGTTSLQVFHHYFSTEQGKIVGQTKSVVVMVNYQKGYKIPMPEAIKADIMEMQASYDLNAVANNNLPS